MSHWRGRAWIVLLAACGRDVASAPDSSGIPDDAASDAARDAPVGPVLPTYLIQTGATVAYTPGALTGYFVSYTSGGHWRLDFTGDATLPTLSGTVSSDYWDELSASQEQSCSPTCTVVPLASVTTGTLGFSATPTQSTDYFIITLDVVPGDPIELDLLINGARQPSAVFYPNNADKNPSALPSLYLPTAL